MSFSLPALAHSKRSDTARLRIKAFLGVLSLGCRTADETTKIFPNDPTAKKLKFNLINSGNKLCERFYNRNDLIQ